MWKLCLCVCVCMCGVCVCVCLSGYLTESIQVPLSRRGCCLRYLCVNNIFGSSITIENNKPTVNYLKILISKSQKGSIHTIININVSLNSSEWHQVSLQYIKKSDEARFSKKCPSQNWAKWTQNGANLGFSVIFSTSYIFHPPSCESYF